MPYGRLVAKIANEKPQDLDLLAKTVWEFLAEGKIDELEAGRISDLIEQQRRMLKLKAAERASKPVLKPVKPQRSPDKQRSLERRRRVAASGRLPPALACRFTVAEQAVLAIVASEVKRCGSCQMPLDKIAALAGCSRTTVQNAIREASRLMLLNSSERRYRGRPSGFNVIKVVDAAWSAWLRLDGRGVGFRKLNSTDTRIKNNPISTKAKGFCSRFDLLDSGQLKTGSTDARKYHSTL